MNTETNLWLIRHAPVGGPRGVIHGPDAPADVGDAAAFAALKARLPAGAPAFCSPARRTRETARALSLDPAEQGAFREQDFGMWTGRRHDDLVAELGAAYRDFWKSPADNRPPGGESFVDQIARAGLIACRRAMPYWSCIPARSARCSRSRLILRPTQRCVS
jgi:alpha-ribazole phosphatase